MACFLKFKRFSHLMLFFPQILVFLRCENGQFLTINFLLSLKCQKESQLVPGLCHEINLNKMEKKGKFFYILTPIKIQCVIKDDFYDVTNQSQNVTQNFFHCAIEENYNRKLFFFLAPFPSYGWELIEQDMAVSLLLSQCVKP